MITTVLTAILLQALILSTDNVKEIVDAMTTEEKAALLVGSGSQAFDGIGRNEKGVPGSAGSTHAIPRLGIPYIVLADGPAGLRISPTREGEDRTFFCTGFPVGVMLSSTWNPALVREVGAAIGSEVLEYGVDVLLAPGANLMRNPLCGRNFEYYSEDPLLSGETAAAYIEGVQQNGVGTSLKHFAVNNQELNRLMLDARVSERALREIYLRGFEIAVRKARPWTIMTSYNYVNGQHASESKDLLTTTLREEWGFEGAVMTDWGGGYDTAAQIRAGNDMIQPGSDSRYKALVAAIKDGSLAMEDVDASVERVLRLILRSPGYKGYRHSDNPDLTAHAGVCKQAADEGIILLKNSRGTLPLGTSGKVALFGVSSYDFIAGGTGSGDVNRPYVVDLKQGLAGAGFALDEAVDGFYAGYMEREHERCKRIDGKNKPWYIDAERPIEVVPSEIIRQAALSADAAIVTIGRIFGEGKDRPLEGSYMLKADEMRLLRTVSEAFHAQGKRLTVILNVGGIVDMRSWESLADAVLLAWQPGQEGGNSVASVLSGDVNPSGHLPMSIACSYEAEPSAGNFAQISADKPFNYSFYRQLSGGNPYEIPDVDYSNYREGVFMGYRHFITRDRKSIAYPFGFGLSYTRFAFSRPSAQKVEGGWMVSVKVTNKGSVPGKDVVQIYVKAPKGGLDKPARELRGYAKTGIIEPGASETVSIFISEESLASFHEGRGAWVAAKGRYTIYAASDALDTAHRCCVRLKEEKVREVPRILAAEPLFID